MNKSFEIALSQYGEREIFGVKDNQEIMKYYHEIGHNEIKHDETAWCAAFVSWCMMKAGEINAPKTLLARDFLKFWKSIQEPEIGDLVIFWRGEPNGWSGHVGFFIREKDNLIYVLGGNQGNKVTISAYSKERLLGYRRANS